MTTNITTLAINLLISERLGHRNMLADKIIEIVQHQNDETKVEKDLKNNFLMVIGKCVENPSCDSRDVFYQLAKFYNEKLSGTEQKVSIAA